MDKDMTVVELVMLIAYFGSIFAAVYVVLRLIGVDPAMWG